MNLQSLVVVALRLMSLKFAATLAIQLAPIALNWSGIYQRSPQDTSWTPITMPAVLAAVLVACAALLWVFAIPIARGVTRGVPGDLSFGALSLADCYSIAFLGLGLFYLTNWFPGVLSWAHYLFKQAASSSGDAWKDTVEWYQLFQGVVPFFFGLALFMKGRTWAVVLARRQAQLESSNPPCHPKPDGPP